MNTTKYKDLKKLEVIKLGDEINIYHPKLDIDITARCIRYRYDCLSKKYLSMELGSFQKNFIDSTNSTTNDIFNKIDENEKNFSSELEKAKDNATNLITNAMGGYVYKTNAELFIMDSDDPSTAEKVWRWNINGLGYSRNGINGPYEVAMTMDGKIVADFITVGVLNAALIKTGVLTSKNGLSWINMENGTFNFANRFINDGTSTIIKSTDSSIWLDLNQGKMMFYEDGTFLGSTNRLYDRWTGKYGLGMLSNTNSFIAFSTGEQDYATIYNPELVIVGKDTVNKDTGEIRYRKGINVRADVHGGNYKNAVFSWTDFPRSKSDGINLYKGIGGDGSQSELILELGDDYTTNFKIISKMYNKDYIDMVAMFRGTGGSEHDPSNSAGIHFYQNLDMHGYRIWGAQTLNAMSLEIESDDAYVKAQSHISFATAEDFKVAKTQYISTSTQKSVNHIGSVIVENEAEYVELPNDFLMCVNINVVATPNKLCKFAVTHVDEYGFIIECDESEVKFDYSVTAHKI